MEENNNSTEFTVNKLVRDNIPTIIEDDNKMTITYICDDEEYYLRLKKKLLEEVNEFIEDENIEELADILEVIYAIGKHKGIPKEQLEAIRAKKVQERGAFDKKIVLLKTQLKD